MQTDAITINFQLNGKAMRAAVPAHWTLLQTLREAVFAYEVKDGCSQGDCGACAVLLDGMAVNACLVPAGQADGCSVTTVSGLAGDAGTATLAEAFVAAGGTQCGYCTPGMMVVGAELLQQNLRPTRQEIRERISGNLCRCTGYSKIVDAIALAAELAAGPAAGPATGAAAGPATGAAARGEGGEA